MPDPQAARRAEPIAIVGLACRFPDASDPAQFLDLVLSQRRAFRRLPPGRLGLDPPAQETGPAAHDGGPARHSGSPLPGAGLGVPPGRGPGGTAPAGGGETGLVLPGDAGAGCSALPGGCPVPRAALLEGWRFDRAAFGVTRSMYRAADPAHWLALETAARALADAGFPGGQGLSRDRTGVIIGNTLTGEVSRAGTLRSRWPYVRRVITSALAGLPVQPAARSALLARAEARFLAPFPEPDQQTLAGSLPSVIADRICGYFGFRGGGHAVDSAHSSSLLAVAAACSALATGDLDAVVAGGVDISLDPWELAGLASTGVLAGQEMRVYDARPTGFWPGEGCGLVVLMRAADARAAGRPAYAQIAGWGTSSAGSPALTRPGSGSLLLALRRAYQRAGVDPADIHLIEGDGTGTASGDLAELTSLAEIRGGAPALAAIGAVKANIGHTKAAAGAAGLIKTALAMAAGVIPPITGCTRPHSLIASEEARLRVPRCPEPWPGGTRLAGVSAVGPGGTSVHLVLRRDNGSGPRRRVRLPAAYIPGQQDRQHGRRSQAAIVAPAATPASEVFAFSGQSRDSLAAVLYRVTALAPWLSDAELHDLACHLGSRSGSAGPVRAAVVASSQDELARRAGEVLSLLHGLRPGRLTVADGCYLADGGRGRVVLLFPGDPGLMAHPGSREPGGCDPSLHPAILASSLASLRLLESLGVTAAAGVGHGVGEITGLVWAGCLSEPDAARLVARRCALLGAAAGSCAPGSRSGGTPEAGGPAGGMTRPVSPASPAISASQCTSASPASPAPPGSQARPGNVAGAPGSPPGPCALVCVATDAPAALMLCKGTGLALAACNGPDCQVLAGPAEDAREVARRAEAEGIQAVVMESPLPFHTPALAGRAGELRTVLREFSFAPPARRLVSTVTGRELTARDDLPDLLAVQLTSPVRFTTALALAAGDADLLVEVGGDQSLHELAAGTCGVPAVGLPGPVPSAVAAAALFTAGATRSLAPLYAGRAARPVDIWRERAFITSPCGRPLMAADAPAHATSPPPAAEGAPGAGTLTDSAPAAGAASAAPLNRGMTMEAAPAGTSPATAPAGTSPAAPSDSSGTQPPARTATGGAEEDSVPGVAPWIRCYTEELRQPARPVPEGAAGPWRVRASRQPIGQAAGEVFEHAEDAETVLAVTGSLAEPQAWEALLRAAGEAAGTGLLVVITTSAGLSGFCASLRGEHPSLGITLIRTSDGAEGLRAARALATAQPGQLREVVLTSEGPREPVMAPMAPDGGGTYPLGPADVLLISGMTTAAELSCAAALGYRGTALAILCQPGAGDDPQWSACLTGLRAGGQRVCWETADLTDTQAVAAAVAELESGLGTVTAVVHGTTAPHGAAAARGGTQHPAAVREHIATQVTGLANVLQAVRRNRLRLLVTFGSVAGRYGKPGGVAAALASEAVAEYAAGRAAGLAGCQALHVAWPAGESGCATPMHEEEGAGVPERARLLQQLLASQDVPRYVAVQGRPEGGAAPGPGEAGLAGRFLETVRVYHPGVELVADARLSPETDPYLADYQIDGICVLPAALALEAMAQAASAVAGEPLRRAVAVSLAPPVVASGITVIRTCALRRGAVVETVLRCEGTGFQVDHARALFHAGAAETAPGAPGGGSRPGTAARRGPGPGGTAPGPGSTAAAPGTHAGSSRGSRPGRVPLRMAGSPGGIVDGTDLYGPVCFQSGRFRRVAFLPEITSRSCRALVRGGDDQPWFGPPPGRVDQPLILGSPGLADAAMQVIQACLPYRRVVPAGCESVMVSGQEVCGALQVHAVRRASGTQGAARAGRQPAERAGQASGVWDVIAVDATGEPVVALVGVRLQEVGPLERATCWHPSLLAVALEGRAIELGLDPSLKVTISTGHPLPGCGGGTTGDTAAGDTAAGDTAAGDTAAGDTAAGDTAAGDPSRQEAGQESWTDTAPGHGPLDGFQLTARAAVPVAIRWEAAGFPPEGGKPVAGGLSRLREQLLAGPGETPQTVDARLRALGASLSALSGQAGQPGDGQAGQPGEKGGQHAAISDRYDNGWVVIRAGQALLASTVVRINGVPAPVAVAIAGGMPPPGPAPRSPAGQSGLAPIPT